MNRILTLLRRAVSWVKHLAHRITAGIHRFVSQASGRLVQRWHSDSVYRRTLIAAASALSATVLPHPAAAAAVGALLADQPTRHRRELYLEEFDDEDYPRRDPRRLWDTFD